MTNTLSKDTKVNVGFVLSLIMVLAGAAFYVKDSITENTTQLLLISQRLENIEETVDTKYDTLESAIQDIDNDRLYRREFTSWRSLLQAENPNITVPLLE